MNSKKTIRKFVTFNFILVMALLIGYYTPLNTNAAEEEKPAMNVEYHSKADIINYYRQHPYDYKKKTVYDEAPSITQPYSPGVLSTTTENAKEMLNLIRYTAGLSSMVHVNTTYNEYAQAGALCNYLNNELSHYPSKPDGMTDELYNIGKSGTSTSNIAYASWKFTLTESLNMYMNDGDFFNVPIVGHRRWLLYPQLSGVGFGQVYNYSATKVINNDVDYRNNTADEYGVAWPAQNTPIELIGEDSDSRVKDYPWSISFDEWVANSVSVKLTEIETGKVWNFSKDYSDGQFYINKNGCGQRCCIIFVPSDLTLCKGSNFKVEISNIGVKGYENDLSYNVSIFSLTDGTGVYYEDGTWNYYVDYNIDYSYTGLVYSNSKWWYVENGKVNFDYDDLYNDSECGWWKVKNGTVDFDYNDLFYSQTCGWWKITGGTVDFGYNDLYNSESCGWWKIKGGAVDFDYNDLYNSESCGWWKIKRGTVDFGYNDLYNSESCGWWKIRWGAVDFDYNDLYFSPTCGWWKVKGGTVDFGYNDLYDSKSCGWWKVKGGTVDFDYNGVFVSPSYGSWRISYGAVKFD